MVYKLDVHTLHIAEAVKCINELKECEDKDVELDFGSMNKVRSDGMIYFVAVVEEMKRRGWNFKVNEDAIYWDNINNHGISYAGNMGFFDALGIQKGKKLGTYSGNSSYCPIVKMNKADLYEETDVMQEGIVSQAQKLSKILTADIPVVEDTFAYFIREMIRNTFEHTSADHIWIAAQRHNQQNKIEVVLADNAEGIRQVITVNSDVRVQVTNDVEALQASIKPGISGNARADNNDGHWANSGYGLYVTSQALSNLGKFVIISGTGILVCKDNEVKTAEVANFQGTLIQLEFDVTKLAGMDKNIISSIVSLGEKEAKQDSSAVHVASKASRMDMNYR